MKSKVLKKQPINCPCSESGTDPHNSTCCSTDPHNSTCFQPCPTVCLLKTVPESLLGCAVVTRLVLMLVSISVEDAAATAVQQTNIALYGTQVSYFLS